MVYCIANKKIYICCLPCPSSWQIDSSPRRSQPACPVPRGGSVESCTGSPCWLSQPVPSCRRGRNKTVSATSFDLSERRGQTRTTLNTNLSIKLQNCSSTGIFELICCEATIIYIQNSCSLLCIKVYTVLVLLLVTLFLYALSIQTYSSAVRHYPVKRSTILMITKTFFSSWKEYSTTLNNTPMVWGVNTCCGTNYNSQNRYM